MAVTFHGKTKINYGFPDANGRLFKEQQIRRLFALSRLFLSLVGFLN